MRAISRELVSKNELSDWMNGCLAKQESCKECFLCGDFDRLQCTFGSSEILYEEPVDNSCNWKLVASSYYCEGKALSFVMVENVVDDAMRLFNILE